MLDAGSVACLELRLATDDDDAWRKAITALRPIVQGRGIAFLLCGRPTLARETGCDGVVIGPGTPFRSARDTVGPQAIVGVHCGTSRHDSMLAGERGADFVGLAPDPDLIGWWVEMMEPPCVAFADGGDLRACVAAGADFMAVGERVWSHPEGAVAGLRETLATLASDR